MSKLQLVLSDRNFTSFDQPWIVNLVKDYFDIVYLEHDPNIDKKAIYVTNVLNRSHWYNPDYKLIIDNLWEIHQRNNQGFVLTNKNWFWYNESLWYKHLNYHINVPNPDIQKSGLLLMNLKKLHRDWLYDNLDLRKLLYSYVGNNIFIDGDIGQTDTMWQRYFNPNWYNLTAFSIVAETTVNSNEPLFVTEKTFKPLAFSHPFIIFGQAGILQYLRSQGFETFENIFDESYDKIDDVNKRLLKIVTQINNYVHLEYDKITHDKLIHNKELFFNQEIVKQRIINEIVVPILEYAET